jgi:pantoate--beta-alanine ligase
MPHIANARPMLAHTRAELQAALAPLRRQGKRLGLVPTMGALHEGHLSLVRRAAAECDAVVVTIFVNPSQFGPGEDLARYPRTLEADVQKLATCGAPIVFAPTNVDVYRPGHETWVQVGAVAEPWEGQFRPGHFRGVATVVLKLFGIVAADIAYFGQKDYQQVQVIRRMVEDLDVPVNVCVCPTMREPDGLAMSSRNAYLSPADRARATVLWKSLQLAQELVTAGQRDAAQITARMRERILSGGDATIDYIGLADASTLAPVAQLTGPTVALLAIRIGTTRLIDNCLLEGLRS